MGVLLYGFAGHNFNKLFTGMEEHLGSWQINV